jgi:hypothetical protein
MKTESPRLRALLAAGAALVVFGITIPATASSGPPADGSLNVPANTKNPPGQAGNITDSGYKCDANQGAGNGNPVFGACGGTGTGTGTGDTWAPDPT